MEFITKVNKEKDSTVMFEDIYTFIDTVYDILSELNETNENDNDRVLIIATANETRLLLQYLIAEGFEMGEVKIGLEDEDLEHDCFTKKYAISICNDNKVHCDALCNIVLDPLCILYNYTFYGTILISATCKGNMFDDDNNRNDLDEIIEHIQEGSRYIVFDIEDYSIDNDFYHFDDDEYFSFWDDSDDGSDENEDEDFLDNLDASNRELIEFLESIINEDADKKDKEENKEKDYKDTFECGSLFSDSIPANCFSGELIVSPSVCSKTDIINDINEKLDDITKKLFEINNKLLSNITVSLGEINDKVLSKSHFSLGMDDDGKIIIVSE